MRFLAISLIVTFMLTGCTATPDSNKTAADKGGAASEGGPARLPVPAVATMEGDRQVVHVVVSDAGYKPATIQLKAGIPARIIFRQETGSECLSHVKIDDMGVPATRLPLNAETAVDFTPGKTGTFTFTCGMEMSRGTIIVAS